MSETETSSNTNKSTELYKQQRFFFMALDPIHIGTGGYRLGRVDMTIAREPGTNLPKIPGTSLAGAARAYAAMSYGKPEAAGQHKKYLESLKKAGKKASDCAILYTFGTATDNDAGQAGTVSIGDARILFFPVASQQGPVWVSTPEILREACGYTLPAGIVPTDTQVVTNLTVTSLNLGWLLLSASPQPLFTLSAPQDLINKDEWKAIKERLVLVTPKVFSQVVNSNLEVRTSVSIDPDTGAASEGALFTYEALPRATWLWCDVIQDDYNKEFPNPVDNMTVKLGHTTPLDVVGSGFKLMEYLGVGGMGTRGFGRIKVVASPIIVQEVLHERAG